MTKVRTVCYRMASRQAGKCEHDRLQRSYILYMRTYVHLWGRPDPLSCASAAGMNSGSFITKIHGQIPQHLARAERTMAAKIRGQGYLLPLPPSIR